MTPSFLELAGMRRLVLSSGLLRRGDGLLLVRCTYPGEPAPLWVLPGGGQEAGEPLDQTVRREFLEETSLRVQVERIAYLSESTDAARDLHVLNCTFWVRESDPQATPAPTDPKVVEARFIPARDAPQLLAADVLRIPVAAALADDDQPRYHRFDADQVAVPFLGRGARGVGVIQEDPRHG